MANRKWRNHGVTHNLNLNLVKSLVELGVCLRDHFHSLILAASAAKGFRVGAVCISKGAPDLRELQIVNTSSTEDLIDFTATLS